MTATQLMIKISKIFKLSNDIVVGQKRSFIKAEKRIEGKVSDYEHKSLSHYFKQYAIYATMTISKFIQFTMKSILTQKINRIQCSLDKKISI